MSQEPTADNPAPNRTRRRQGALGGLLVLLASSYVDILLGIVRGIMVRNYVGPTGRGMMRLVDIAGKWLSHSHLGSLFGLSKQLPLTLGRADEAGAQELEDLGTTVVLGTGLLGSLVLLGFALWGPHLEGTSRVALGCGAGIVWIGQAYALYRVILRAWGTYTVLALASVATTVSQFVLIIGGAKYYGVRGAMVGWLVSGLVQMLYLAYGSRLHVKLCWDWRKVGLLIVSGVPLGATVFADVFMRTADGLVIARYMSLTQLGLYDVAMQVASYLYRIPEAIGFVLMPRIWESYGAEVSTERIRKHITLPTMATAFVVPTLSGAMFILVPFLVKLLLPKFQEGIFAAQVLALACFFLALPIAANGLLIAVNREITVTLVKLLGGAVVAACSLYAVLHGGSLGLIAQFAAAGYFLASTLSLLIALHYYYPSPAQLLWTVVALHLPFVYAVGMLKLSGLLIRDLFGAAADSNWMALVRLALFLVLNLPVLWFGNHITGVLTQIAAVVRARLLRPRERTGPAPAPPG